MSIPIFYACDDSFLKYTIVSLSSMMQNASKEYDYQVYILHTDISKENQQRALKLENENFHITFVDVTEYLGTISDRLPLRNYYNITTYYRFFIAGMFPQYDKAIYLDSDTIVQGDISELYQTDIGDCYLGACNELTVLQTESFATYVERVVGVPYTQYFNAGVLLMNCEQFRKNRILDVFIHYLNLYVFIVAQDQDYLNLICNGHVCYLDQRWNTELPEWLTYSYDPRDAHILHYALANKPWHYKECRLSDVFWKYAKKTSVYRDLQNELATFSDEDRENDRIAGEDLFRLVLEETEKIDKLSREKHCKLPHLQSPAPIC